MPASTRPHNPEEQSRMFLRQFEYLVALSEKRHFGHAAASCNVSQSGLSNAIRQLEDELGITIVLRDRKFLGFTDEGRRLVEWAQRLLVDRDTMLQELSHMRGALHGHLRLGAMPSSSPILPHLTSKLTRRHPNLTISIQFLAIGEIRRQILNFEIDIGVGYLSLVGSQQIAMRLLYNDDMGLLVPRRSPLADLDTVSWSEAAEVPLCLLPRTMEERRIVDSVFAAQGLHIKPRIEADSFVNLAFHVMQGDYSTVIAGHFRTVLGAFPNTKIIGLKSPRIQQQIGIFWFDKKPLLPLIGAVHDLLNEIDDVQNAWLAPIGG